MQYMEVKTMPERLLICPEGNVPVTGQFRLPKALLHDDLMPLGAYADTDIPIPLLRLDPKRIPIAAMRHA
jgi:hypothetical protein